MPVYRHAGSLIPVDSFTKGGLWPAEKQPDTTPALHKPVVEEPEDQVPSALHPRVDAPAKRTRVRQAPKPAAKKVVKRRAKKPATPPVPDEVQDAVEAVAAALRESLEPRIVTAAERTVAKKVLELFGGDR